METLTTPGGKEILIDIEFYTPKADYDLRYATDNNITGKQLYFDEDTVPRLHREVAHRFIYAYNLFIGQGFIPKIYDTFRTEYAQQELMKVMPNPKFVNPFSTHLQGMSVDLLLTDMAGNLHDFGTHFDDFSPAAAVDYKGKLSDEQKFYRNKLINTMRMAGFKPWPNEIYHYDLIIPIRERAINRLSPVIIRYA